MIEKNFTVAIELGSSKITGIAGKKLPDGSIQILAIASENASDCIRKGVIYNLDKTTLSLTSIIRKLQSALQAAIGKVYIGTGGQSLRTIRNTEVRHLDEETKISQELIDSLKDSNRAVPIVGYQILGVVPQEYKVGNNLITDPVGVLTNHIEARFLNIIARKNIKENIAQCCNSTDDFHIADDAEDLIAPLTMADAVLKSDEKRSGCVLVDFGADTTTVMVYKNNILRHLAVIPLGGSNITKDICSQQIEEEDAEALKIQFGQAYVEPQEGDDENKVYTLEGRCSINALLLEDIVEARVNEILDNVLHQVVLSGYENELLAGAVITGGGSNLRNMEEAFTNRTKIKKVRTAKETQIPLKGIEISKDGTYNTLIALLNAGKENCYLPTLNPGPAETVKRPSSPASVIEGELFDKDGQSMEEKKKKEELEFQQQKAASLAQQKAEKEAQEAEKRRKAECEDLIQKAVKLKNDAKYSEALKVLKKASDMDIAEKATPIQALKDELEELKSKNSLAGRLGSWINNLLDENN